MLSQIDGELVQSLDEEIDALKNPRGRSRGANIVKIFNGRFLRELLGLNIYLFNLENFLIALDDSPAVSVIQRKGESVRDLLNQYIDIN